MRYTSLRTTDRYIHGDMDRQREVIDGRYLAPASRQAKGREVAAKTGTDGAEFVESDDNPPSESDE